MLLETNLNLQVPKGIIWLEVERAYCQPAERASGRVKFWQVRAKGLRQNKQIYTSYN